nr:phosphonate C-P lyase system protein PhnH [Lysinibacillus timonensis]
MTVHITQQAFRQVLDALSFPGKVNKLAEGPNAISVFIPQTGLVCQTLLDSEVTFYVAGDEPNISKMVQAYTGSHITNIKEADFVIFPLMLSLEEALTSLKSVKVGDLVNPHNSATIIYEVESLVAGYTYKLVGPGIKDINTLTCSLNPAIFEIRKEINTEYPLGIDLIIIDRQGNVMGIPRTTQITEVM